MFTVSKKQTRISTIVPFFSEFQPLTDLIIKHIKEKYYDTKKIIRFEKYYTDDKLTVITVTCYSSYECFKEFVTDIICEKYIFIPNTKYDIENGITSDIKFKKE